MLSALRHKGVAKKVAGFFTVIILLSFLLSGFAINLDNTVNSAGSLYGKSVSIKDFQKTYLDARDQAIILYGDRFFKMGSRLDLENETWDRLILTKEAKKRGIVISDQELVANIAQVPFFQREGKFDKQLYEIIVKNQNIFNRNTRDFEEGMRAQLAIRKLVDMVAGNGKVTDEELQKEFKNRYEKLKLSYLLFSPQDYINEISVTDDEIKAFYESRKDQFKLPATISLNYVQINFPDKASDTDKTKIKQEAMTLYSQAKSEGLTQVAAKSKLEVKQSPFFSMEQPLLTFVTTPEEVEKLFAFKKGELVSPREMPDGWQIVQINDKKESYIPSFDEAKAQAKEALSMQKAFDIAKTKADEILAKIKADIKLKDFKTVAEALKLKVDETPLFSRGEYIANMGLVAEFQQEANQLTKENPLSTVVATSQGAAILHLDQIEAPTEEQFNAEKESFTQMLEAQKRNQAMITFMTKLQAEAKMKSKIKRQ